MCQFLSGDCTDIGRVCKGDSCVLPPASPTPTPKQSPKPPTNSTSTANQNEKSLNSSANASTSTINGTFLEVDRQEMAFSVTRPLFQGLVESPIRLFGNSEFDLVNYRLRFPGLRLRKVDPQSFIGVFLFREGDQIVQVNETKTRNGKALLAALRAASTDKATKMVKITYVRNHIFYSAMIALTEDMTPKSKAAK
jgi:membrane-associated protease RseP (regulator of RpoE activity)